MSDREESSGCDEEDSAWRFIRADLRLQIQVSRERQAAESLHMARQLSHEPALYVTLPQVDCSYEEEGLMAVQQASGRRWFLVDADNQRIPLPASLVSIGSAQCCDVQIQSPDVDPQQALLTFDPTDCSVKVKDVSTRGTFINEVRVSSSDFTAVNTSQDLLRFGDDLMEYRVEYHDTDPSQAHPAPDTPPSHAAEWTPRDPSRPPDHMPQCPGCAVEHGRPRHLCIEDYHHPYPAYPPPYSATSLHLNPPVHNGHPTSARSAYGKWGPDHPPRGYRPGYPQRQRYVYPVTSPEQEPDPYYPPDLPDHPSYQPTTVYPESQRSFGGHYSEAEEYGPHEVPPYMPRVAPPGYGGPHCHHHSYHHPYDSLPPAHHVHHRPYPKLHDPYHYLTHQPSGSQYPQHQPSDVSGVTNRVDKRDSGDSDKETGITTSDNRTVETVGDISDREVRTVPDQCDKDISDITTDHSQPLESAPCLTANSDLPSVIPSHPVTADKDSTELCDPSAESVTTDELEGVVRSSEVTLSRRDSSHSIEGEGSGVRKSSLYGQPAWWGQEGSEYNYPHTATLTGKQGPPSDGVDVLSDRPSSLQISPDDQLVTDDTTMHSYKDLHYNGTRGPTTLHTPPERDPGPSDPPAQDKPSAMAFTISFGGDDEDEKKKAPLSQFLPQKVRKNFRQREKEKERRESIGSRESSAERSQRQSREASPSSRKSKSALTSPRTPRRGGGYHSDGHHSNASSDLEDSSTHSENTTSRGKTSPSSLPSSQTSGPKTPSKSSSKTRHTPTKIQEPKHTTTRTSVKEKRRKAASVASSSYLIEKMLQPAKPSQDGDQNLQLVGDYTENAPEYELYREAKTYDRQAKTRQRASPEEEPNSYLMPPKVDAPDDVSEAGTYTIEVHQSDISEARQSIDAVFGVDSEEVVDFEVAVGAGEGLRHLEATQDDHGQSVMRAGSQQQVDGIVQGGKSAPKWPGQWTGSQKVPGSAAPVHPTVKHTVSQDSSHNGSETEDAPLVSTSAHKPPYIPSRRTRAGRKLPSPPSIQIPPPVITSQPISRSPCVDREDSQSPGRQRATITYDADEGSCFSVSYDAPVRQSSVPRDDDLSSGGANSPSVMRPGSGHSPGNTARSGATLDTELLLGNTEQLIRAVKQRAEKKRSGVVSNGRTSEEPLFVPIREPDSDSDTSSTCAVVDGAWPSGRARVATTTPPPALTPPRTPDTGNTQVPDYGTYTKKKPSYLKSVSVDPRNLTSPPTQASKDSKERRKSAREEYFSQLATKQRRSSFGKKERERQSMEYSESESVVSTSTDYSENTASPALPRRTRSAGKGNITITRPNRAFALRRAKADGDTPSDTSIVTPRSSRPSSAGKNTDDTCVPRSRSNSRSRPTSAQDTNRSQKTDASLGQKIVQKSRDNMRQPSTKSTTPTAVTHTDLHSRGLRPSKSSVVQKSTSEPRRTTKPPISSRSSSSSASGLSVTGNGTHPPPQPESPHSQEYSAWQRRKKYDPRKAVADSKTGKKPMRSKSAAEADQLKKRVHGETKRSISSVSGEDCLESQRLYRKSMNKAAGNVVTSAHMDRKLSDRESKVSDSEEESSQKVQSFRSSLSSDLNRSAFSVPKTKCSPSPPPLSGSSCRTLSMRHLLQQEEATMRRHESYDTLIVSSIYQLSQKVKGYSNSITAKLREQKALESSPQPMSDILSHDLLNSSSDITGWRSANQELAGILSNLRLAEHQLRAIHHCLNRDEDDDDSLPARKTTPKSDLTKNKPRCTSFQPIDRPPIGRGRSHNKPVSAPIHKQPSHDSDNSDQLTGSDYY